MSNRTTPSDKLRYVSIGTLLKIRSNNYESVFYKGHTYNKEAVENEIKRKQAKKSPCSENLSL